GLFLFQAEDGIRDRNVTGVQTCALPISTAMNMFRPTLFNTHCEGSGMRPKVGCLLRSQPKNKPAINAPPLVLKLMGMPPIWMERDRKSGVKGKCVDIIRARRTAVRRIM